MPFLSVAFKKRAGMIWSVSMSLTGSATTREVREVNWAILAISGQGARISHGAGQGAGSGG